LRTPPPRLALSPGERPRHAVVRALPFSGDDAALLQGLQAGRPAAIAAFCDLHSTHVLRVLARILGAGAELADLHQDVFTRALRGVAGVKDASALRGWITIIAVNVARSAIKRRAIDRWLSFLPWHDLPEIEAPTANDDDVEALRRTYAALDRLPTEERIAFALRIIDGLELTEAAAACGVSLATFKRRLTRAEARFITIARQDPHLAAELEGGDRWGHR
jgi:RNA polymerase sigma-70 factor (ECF subfamily)